MLPRIDSWLHLPKGQFNLREIRQRLELKAVERAGGAPSPTITLWRETPDGLAVPRQAAFLDTSVLHCAINCTIEGEARDFGEPIPLRPHQVSMVDGVMRALIGGHPYGGLMCAKPGFGKTVMGLEVMRRLGRTSLILVHKEFLAYQWAERIREFLPNARVGFIQQDQHDYGDGFDVVIGMLQSFHARTYPDSLFQWPGVVLSDEVHRVSSATWWPVIAKFPAKVRLGLTATPRRADGLEQVFFWHIGPIIGEPDASGVNATMVPVVKVIYYRERYMLAPFVLGGGRFNSSKWLTYLGDCYPRNLMLAGVLQAALRNGRKVLALSHRLSQLDQIQAIIEAALPWVTVGKYIGGTAQAKLDVAAQARLVLGTFSMAAEGLDVPDLDTLVLLTPQGDVEQSVGRIQRALPGKPTPVVIDVIDTHVTYGMALSKIRGRTYRKIGAEVRT